MAIYEIGPDKIVPFKKTTFQEAGIQERGDLQHLLRTQIEVVSPNTLVIAEGFREWEESRREIDLLGLDKEANLVVIELKRTEDAGHAELQAIRYAAMVSAMTFEKATAVYGDHLRRAGRDKDAQAAILEFLEWEEPDEERFGQDVRIVLVAADFSKELTTSVMWLNERQLDIRCVWIKPYDDRGRTLVDVQQVIPLPEAADYTVRIREKATKERQDRGVGQQSRQVLRRAFWQSLLERSRGKSDLFANVSPSEDIWIWTGSGYAGVHLSYVIRKHDSTVQLVLEAEKAKNKEGFDFLHSRRGDIEQAYGSPLDWHRREDVKKSYLAEQFADGGYRDAPEQWPAIQDKMIDAMIRLEKVIKPHLGGLRAAMAGQTEMGKPEETGP